ncbi:MAG: hypothetical protein WEC54_03545 [Gemmatimonadales bacterium]
MKHLLATAGAILALGTAAPAVAQGMPAPPPSETTTITGTVVDLSCKFTHNLTGDGHRMCAQVCADQGVPLVILGSDGQVYLPVGEGMPSAGQNARLRDFAEQQVRITGQVFAAGDSKVILITNVRRA